MLGGPPVTTVITFVHSAKLPQVRPPPHVITNQIRTSTTWTVQTLKTSRSIYKQVHYYPIY